MPFIPLALLTSTRPRTSHPAAASTLPPTPDTVLSAFPAHFPPHRRRSDDRTDAVAWMASRRPAARTGGGAVGGVTAGGADGRRRDGWLLTGRTTTAPGDGSRDGRLRWRVAE